jgi:gliding motility-associated-like protein
METGRDIPVRAILAILFMAGGSFIALAQPSNDLPWGNSNNDNGLFRICVTAATGAEPDCPGAYQVSGGGSFCDGDTGVVVILSGSEPGVLYTLLMNDTLRLDTIPGTGGSLAWSPLSEPGTYRVEAEDPSGGCTVMMSDSAEVAVLDRPQLSAEIVSVTCFGDNDGSIRLDVDPGLPCVVEWTGPGGFISGEEILENLAPGEYSATVTASNGCVAATSIITITEPGLLVASVEQVSHLTSYEANDGSVGLNITGGTTPYEVSWTGTDDYASSDEDATGMTVGYYSVMVTDSHQCMDSIEMIPVLLSEDADPLFIPEGFSPNGDGYNDRFVVVGIEQFPENELMVFNRQGVEVLHRVNYGNDWDGRPEKGGIPGSQLPEGTYYYIFKYGASGLRKGYVYINRE